MVPLRRYLWHVLFLFVLLGSCGNAYGQHANTKVLDRIAFGSCAKETKPQPIWQSVVGLRPDLFIFLGDNIYGDTTSASLLKQKYSKLAAQPGYQLLKSTCPILATWDDHDYGANDAGADYPMKKESQQIFLDFFGVPPDSPRRRQEGIYQAEIFGPPEKRVQIILLDTRYFRSALKKRPDAKSNEGPYLANDNPEATLLGAAQWKWLEEQLHQPARLRIIVSSIQLVAEDHGWEKWMNFPHERERFINLLKQTKAGGVIILSGDRHLAEISMMDAGLGYPLFDVTSSGLTEADTAPRPFEVNRHRVATMNWGNHFGLITIDWHKADPVVGLQIRDEDGDIRIQQKLLLSQLHSEKFIAKASDPSPEMKSEPTQDKNRSSNKNSSSSNKSSSSSDNDNKEKKIIPSEDAGKYVGKEMTVEFEVKATGAATNLVFLNSKRSRNDDDNFTVVIQASGVDDLKEKKKIDNPREYFRNKKVRVTGKIETFRDKPQIKVTKANQIVVVE